jgi:hypothetical protein
MLEKTMVIPLHYEALTSTAAGPWQQPEGPTHFFDSIFSSFLLVYL